MNRTFSDLSRTPNSKMRAFLGRSEIKFPHFKLLLVNPYEIVVKNQGSPSKMTEIVARTTHVPDSCRPGKKGKLAVCPLHKPLVCPALPHQGVSKELKFSTSASLFSLNLQATYE